MKLNRRIGPSLLATLLLATAILTAQTPKPPQTGPKFRAATDAISTDVRVQDAAGRFIPDLTVKDFEVYEDGVRQTITNFVAMVGGRAMTEIAPIVETVREGMVLPRTSRPPTIQGRIFIIFIDDLHLQPSDSIKAKEVLKAVRDNLIHDEDLVGIVTTGYSSVSFDVGPDPRHLRINEAIEKTMGAGMTPIETIQTSQTVEGPSGLRHNAHVAFKLAYEILDQAEKVSNRRKAFIYITSGYDFNPFTDARYKAIQSQYSTPPPVEQTTAGNPLDNLSGGSSPVYRNPFEMNGLQFSDAILASELGELVRRARRANVLFYPVDPRGLIAGPDAGQPISTEEWFEFVNTTLSSMDVLAGETGGTCVCRTNNIKGGLQRIDNEMSDYYVVGYESNNPDPLKIERKIQIKVLREGAQKPIYNDTYRIKR
jgi:VWFA-related protein